MKTPFKLLGSASILLLLVGCASSDSFVRIENRNSLPIPSNSLVQEHAESLIRANPDIDEATAYQITKRRLVGTNEPSKEELKLKVARQEFRDDLADALGTP